MLLQALVAPLVLIATVIVSFFGTLGLSMLFFRFVVGRPGRRRSLPTFAFIFLVALGDRLHDLPDEPRARGGAPHGTREGMLRALAATGPVITSAGVILAGTFSVLMTLPVTFAFNIGFMVAVGILLDTFIVRTIMVPGGGGADRRHGSGGRRIRRAACAPCAARRRPARGAATAQS